MRVWLVTTGEPLPIDSDDVRLLRAGLLARRLAARGHEVVWWTASFDHLGKRHRVPRKGNVAVGERISLEMIDSVGYARNVSPRRLWDHAQLGMRFRRAARHARRPDVILASYPTIELAAASAELGARWGVPAVVDLRDAWPDALVDAVPKGFRPLAWLATRPLDWLAGYALRKATALTAHTGGFLEWGLEKAGRSPRPADRVFPFGYEWVPVGVEDVREATEWWAARGVRLGAEQIVAYAGTISRQVDWEMVLAAAERLRDRRGIRFVICGTGTRLDELRARTQGAANIIFPGWCDRRQIQALLSNSLAGLMPYRDVSGFRDSIPNKAIEYMAAGLPILWSLDSGVLADLIRRERIGVPGVGDPERLTLAIGDLDSSPEEQRAQGRRARSLYETHFDAEGVYGSFVDYLEALANNRAAPTPAASP